MQTRKRLCASCLKFNFNKTLKSSKKHKPKWLNKIDYVEEFIKNYKNFNINYPINYNNSLICKLRNTENFKYKFRLFGILSAIFLILA